MDPMTAMMAMQAGQTIIGGVGSALNAGLSDEQQAIYDLLGQRARYGMDPETLRKMRLRARGAVGNQGTAMAQSTKSRLTRAGAPVAKQEEVLSKVRSQRMGAISGALTGVDALNEQIKSSALGQLAGFGAGLGDDAGAGFSQLMGGGLGGLQSMLEQEMFMERLEKLQGGGGGGGVSNPSYGSGTSTYQRNMWR